jgi:hypothetical protein
MPPLARAHLWPGRLAPVVVGLMTGLWAQAATADPRLDEMVYSPYVEAHTLELEARTAHQNGGALRGANTTVLEAEYGVNDRLSLALVVAREKDTGQPSRLTSVGLEGIAYLGRIPGIGVDAGLYLEYAAGQNGEEDGGEAKLLLAKTEGNFQGLLNLIAERPFNAPKGQGYAEYGYAASATWRTVGRLRLGVEAFGDLGDDHGLLRHRQGAYIGPQVKWEGRPKGSPVSIVVDAGWLAAVGPNRQEGRTQTRLSIELERHF